MSITYAQINKALLLNASLLAIHRVESVPLTDSGDDLSYLSAKYRRMFDKTYHGGADINSTTIRQHVARLDTQSGLLSAMALEVLVPNIDCENVDDILEIRERFEDHLQAFRLKMMSLATTLKTTVADQEFERECRELIVTTLAPELFDLQKKLRLSRLKVLNKLIKKTLSLKPTVPFIVSVFAPVPLYAAALVAAGIISLETALETYLEKQELLHNNGLAYLLDVGKSELNLDLGFWSRSSSLS